MLITVVYLAYIVTNYINRIQLHVLALLIIFAKRLVTLMLCYGLYDISSSFFNGCPC